VIIIYWCLNGSKDPPKFYVWKSGCPTDNSLKWNTSPIESNRVIGTYVRRKMLAVIHGKYYNPIKNETSNHSHNSTTNPLLNNTTHTPAQLINITLPRPPTIHHITHRYHRSSPKYHRTLFRYQYVTPRSTRSTIQGQTKIWHSPQKVFHEKDEEFCGADPFATKPKIKQPQSTSLFPVFVRNKTINPGKSSLAPF